jgi:uncharacterized membrane protein YphA (DoxX/SURF4 family)
VSLLRDYGRDLGRASVGGWDRFWFTPADPATLGLIRILAGAMLLYTHLIWTKDLDAFFGADPWLSVEAVQFFQEGPPANADPAANADAAATAANDGAGQGGAPGQGGNTAEAVLPAELLADGAATATNGDTRSTATTDNYAWSYLNHIQSRTVLWTAHVLALVIFAMLMLGLWTRVTSVLGFLITVAYANRVPGALFGLDDINGMLALYLAVGPSGAAYSLDRLIARGRAGGALPIAPRVGANIAIRLIQLHMCVIYLFAGIGKLQGETWWAGTALWLSFASLEYQSLDMTWMANWPLTINFLTHFTVFWEVFFCALVWPRLLRPIVLAIAIPLHLGIGLCMGMMTFGIVMLFGCLAFVPSWLVRRAVDPWIARLTGSSAAEPAPEAPPVAPASRGKNKSKPRTANAS